VAGCGPVPTDGSPLPEAIAIANHDGSLNGVWISDGYGWVFDIEGETFRAYNHTSAYCRRDLEIEETFAYGGDASRVENGRLIGGSALDPTRYAFDRVGGLPASCSAAPAESSPELVFDAFVATLSDHYAFFEVRGVAWDSLTRASRAQVTPNTSDEDLREIFKGIMSDINDPHVTLEGPDFLIGVADSESDQRIKSLAASRGVSEDEAMTDWLMDHIRRNIREEIFSGPSEARGRGRINFGSINEDVGYLSIVSFGQLVEGEMEASVDEINTALDDAIDLWGDAGAVIVDVSGNGGGVDYMARTLAARFASESTTGVYKYAGDAKDQTPQALTLAPSDRTRFTGEVFVLTTDLTVSAGETFVLYMRAQPNVTHVGEPTRGALSDMLYKPLPNGWSVSVSNEVYLDKDNKLWEGRGIEPEVLMTVFVDGNPYEGHSDTVKRLVEMIMAR